MKIIAIERELPATAPTDFTPHLGAEAAHLWKLYQSGVVREFYFRADRHEAVLILECSSLEEAEEILNSLPLVQEKLITFDLIPLKPYSGFARLFTDFE